MVVILTSKLQPSLMNKVKVMLRKCKSLSKIGRSSSYSSLRSKSAREEDLWADVPAGGGGGDGEAIVFVGSSRRRYIISSKHLDHPLLNALIDRTAKMDAGDSIAVRCEVVLFDHLLWMLENNADPVVAAGGGSLEELVDLYVF